MVEECAGLSEISTMRQTSPARAGFSIATVAGISF
jgi:hypothetical protein